jgi:hypothetical protein
MLADCEEAGGLSGGAGSECATYDCPEFEGACCLCDGSCTVTMEPCCDYAGGTFLGGGTDCGEALATILSEDFNAGIPADWTIIDAAGVGWSWELNSTTGRTNYTGGDGDCMVSDADEYAGYPGYAYPYDNRLITPPLAIIGGATLEFDAAYNFMSSVEAAEVNITINGGADWTNLLTWMEDHSSYGPGEHVALDLSAYAGETALIEFRHYGDGWDWYFEVDNVVVTGEVEADNPCPQPAALDIKPGSCPNSFNRSSHGVLPVALMSTEQVDVTMVDISTVLLSRADGIGGSVGSHEGPPGPHSVYGDVATPQFPPCEGEACDCHELEGDGIVDLKMKFKTDNLVPALELDDLLPGAMVELVVTGFLTDGTPFTASDCIRLVPPGSQPGMLWLTSNQPGAWLDLTPLDDQLDLGGFAGFERSYPQTTVVTLTAEETFGDRPFTRWIIDSVPQPLGVPTVQVTVDGVGHNIAAKYQASTKPGHHLGDNSEPVVGGDLSR